MLTALLVLQYIYPDSSVSFICTLVKLSVLWCIIPYSGTPSSTLVHQQSTCSLIQRSVLWYTLSFSGTSIIETVVHQYCGKSICTTINQYIYSYSGTSLYNQEQLSAFWYIILYSGPYIHANISLGQWR